MEGKASERVKFVPHALEYVRSFPFGDVDSSAYVLFFDGCAPHFAIHI
jgi:hypothetical protein